MFAGSIAADIAPIEILQIDVNTLGELLDTGGRIATSEDSWLAATFEWSLFGFVDAGSLPRRAFCG